MTPPRVASYRFGHIIIDNETYGQDVIILPSRVIGGWWRERGHRLSPDDLDPVFEAAPEVLVVGQGKSGRMKIAPATKRVLQEREIELIAAPTESAIRTYNDLRTTRAVAAALHLTC
jgi:hypothetical protein